MSSKKGYVSFFLFFILSTGVLTLSFPQMQSQSVAPAYVFKSTHDNHVLLKRVFRPALESAVHTSQQQFFLIEKFKEGAITTGPFYFVISKLTRELKMDVIRLNVLLSLDQATTEHSSNSNFHSTYYCESTSFDPKNSVLFSNTSTSFIANHWLECWNNIEIRQVTTSNFAVSIIGDMYVQTSHITTNTKMNSKIQPFEVSFHGVID